MAASLKFTIVREGRANVEYGEVAAFFSTL
jgi:hypothetical protein